MSRCAGRRSGRPRIPCRRPPAFRWRGTDQRPQAARRVGLNQRSREGPVVPVVVRCANNRRVAALPRPQCRTSLWDINATSYVGPSHLKQFDQYERTGLVATQRPNRSMCRLARGLTAEGRRDYRVGSLSIRKDLRTSSSACGCPSQPWEAKAGSQVVIGPPQVCAFLSVRY